MKPIEMRRNAAEDLFRHRLENILDMRHELVHLSELIDWSSLVEDFGSFYSEEVGRPGKPIRLMAGLILLQHTYSLSDEEVVLRWRENPYWQYFCGFEYFHHDFPIDPSRVGSQRVTLIIKSTFPTAPLQTAHDRFRIKQLSSDLFR